MLLYILKSIFCLLLFLGFYHLVLEKEKMHRFNRFYLLGSIVFAFIVPSFTITVVAPTEYIEPVAQDLQMMTQLATSDVVFEEQASINYINYLFVAYFIVSGILFLFFTKNIYRLLSKTRKNEQVNYFTATVILLKEQVLPHTFLKYIFINKKEYTNDQQKQLILTHELAHVKQKHSIDVLFIELLQIVFWCVPIFKFYKKAIQLNHEFLADDAVIKSHKNISEYQHILLNTSAQNNNIYLASNLNYSLTKKRLLMMTTPSSKTKILLKKLLVLPLTAGFIFAFAQRVEAQDNKNMPQIVEVNENPTKAKVNTKYRFIIYLHKDDELFVNGKKIALDHLEKSVKNNHDIKNKQITEVVLISHKDASNDAFEKSKNILNKYGELEVKFTSKQPWSLNSNEKFVDGISEKEMNEYKKLLAKAKEDRIYIYKNLIRMKDLYRKMSLKQQNSVEDIYKIAPPQPQIIRERKTPTLTQYNSWKNNQKFALWIDGKTVDNSVLNNHKNTDFSYFTGSKVYKNARSKSFPQEYQFRLYTKPYFAKIKELEKEKSKNTIRIQVGKEGNLNINNDYTSFIDDLAKNLDKLNIDKKKAHISINYHPKVDVKYLIQLKTELRNYGIYKLNFHKNGPLFEDVRVYNSLVKRIEETKIYEKGQLDFLKRLYNKFSDKEKSMVKKPSIIKIPPKPQVIEIKKQQKTAFHKNWFITIDGQKYFYTFDKNERVARYYKNGKLVKLDIVKEYKKKHKIFEQLKNTGKHYVFKSASEKKVIDREFSDLGGMYFRMPRADKNKVPFPNNPHGEYAKIRRKDGSHYYKKRSELNSEDKKLLNRRLPPPPALKKNATKKEIERYNKAYKFWKEKTKRLPPPPPKQKIKEDRKLSKRQILIKVSKDGEFLINKDNTYKNFERISITSIERILANLSTNEIKNTFVFSKSKDLNKFRSKPAKSIEYQDDIEIHLIKTKIKYIPRKGKKHPMVQFALDNKNADLLEKHVQKIGKVFKKYGIKNMTI